MTEAEFKRKLAKLLLEHAEQYVEQHTREELKLAQAVYAASWWPSLRLSNGAARVFLSSRRSLKNIGFLENFEATFSANGSVNATTCAEVADLLKVAMVIAAKAQKLVERYNAGVRKQTKDAGE